MYIGQVMSVMNNLFVDVIMGKDFTKKHNSVTFNFNGNNPPLQFPFNQNSSCNLTSMQVEPPSLFSNMSPDTKPIACKSRRYSPDDMKFIQDETKRLLDSGIIEPSNSSWRAQLLVVPETESHRKKATKRNDRRIRDEFPAKISSNGN